MLTNSNDIPVSTRLFYLITISDGKMDAKEIEMGHKMIRHEGLDIAKFNNDIQSLIAAEENNLLEDCLGQLSRLNKTQQVNILAWMCLIANSDGFMDNSEWQLIYKIYHKHLGLPVNEIMTRQKELNHVIRLSYSKAGLHQDSTFKQTAVNILFPL